MQYMGGNMAIGVTVSQQSIAIKSNIIHIMMKFQCIKMMFTLVLVLSI